MYSMDYLCCPRCHETLEEARDENNCFYCAACGSLFPAYEGHANFTAASDLDEFSQWQREIYDGKVGSVCPPGYADPEGVRSHNEHCMEIADRTGLIQPNWKGLKSRQVMDRLRPRDGELVLDVGCGLGTLLNTMHSIYRTRGVGIDFSHAGMKAAISYNPCDNDYHVADALMLPFRDGSFDLTVSYDVIEHVTEPRRFASEMARVLKPGGRLRTGDLHKQVTALDIAAGKLTVKDADIDPIRWTRFRDQGLEKIRLLEAIATQRRAVFDVT